VNRPSRFVRSERVAQPVEHVTFNHGVLGSSPSALTKQKQALMWISSQPCCLSYNQGNTTGIGKSEDSGGKRCSPELFGMILDSDTGNSIQIFERELCGERSWDE
jgi:hypothetical protein